jgi:hypothetical protein
VRPAALLAEARALVERPASADLVGLWPRAAALCARRALEEALDQLWRARAAGLEATTTRAQLIALPTYLGDRELAGDVAFTYAALSNACHHHDYELTPTAGELDARFAVLDRLIARVEHLAPDAESRQQGRTRAP